MWTHNTTNRNSGEKNMNLRRKIVMNNNSSTTESTHFKITEKSYRIRRLNMKTLTKSIFILAFALINWNSVFGATTGDFIHVQNTDGFNYNTFEDPELKNLITDQNQSGFVIASDPDPSDIFDGYGGGQDCGIWIDSPYSDRSI